LYILWLSQLYLFCHCQLSKTGPQIFLGNKPSNRGPKNGGDSDVTDRGRCVNADNRWWKEREVKNGVRARTWSHVPLSDIST
jgi:hypothetical protein